MHPMNLLQLPIVWGVHLPLGDSSIPIIIHLLQNGSKILGDVICVSLCFPTRGAVGHPSMLPFLAFQSYVYIYSIYILQCAQHQVNTEK